MVLPPLKWILLNPLVYGTHHVDCLLLLLMVLLWLLLEWVLLFWAWLMLHLWLLVV